MANLNEIKKPRFSGDDRYRMASIYLDKLFPTFPKYHNFVLFQAIGKTFKGAELKQEFSEAMELQSEIEDLLTNKFNYAEKCHNSTEIQLTDLGREVQEIGGHSTYEKFNAKNESLKKVIKPLIEKYEKDLKSKEKFVFDPNLFNPNVSPTYDIDYLMKSDETKPVEKKGFWWFVERVNLFTGAANGLVQLIFYILAAFAFLAIGWKVLSFIYRIIIK